MGIPILAGMALGGAFNGHDKPPPPPPSSAGTQAAGQAAHTAEITRQAKGNLAAAAVSSTSTKANDMGNMTSGKEMGFA